MKTEIIKPRFFNLIFLKQHKTVFRYLRHLRAAVAKKPAVTIVESY